MLISTRGRYALRIMIDLAERGSVGYTPMKEVAQHLGISLKYIEQIIPVLSRNGRVVGVHGKGGGYRLCRAPEAYTVGEILRLTEGDLAPVACLECGSAPCPRAAECRTVGMWNRFQQLIDEFFDDITIADLMREDENHLLKDPD